MGGRTRETNSKIKKGSRAREEQKMEMLRRKKRGKREGSEGCKNNARGRKTSTLKRVSSLADVKLGRSTMNLQREASCRPTTTTATEMRFKYPLVLADIRLACSPRELVVSLRALAFLPYSTTPWCPIALNLSPSSTLPLVVFLL